jgi:hypothetical protein
MFTKASSTSTCPSSLNSCNPLGVGFNAVSEGISCFLAFKAFNADRATWDFKPLAVKQVDLFAFAILLEDQLHCWLRLRWLVLAFTEQPFDGGIRH